MLRFPWMLTAHPQNRPATLLGFHPTRRKCPQSPDLTGFTRTTGGGAGDEGALHEALWFYHEGNRALRQANWKIVHTVGARNRWRDVAAMEDARPGDWALYDLSTDRAEQHDLAAKHPDRVRSMASLWERWKDGFMLDVGDR